MISAFLNLNKERGMTSAKAVAKVKHLLLEKGVKPEKIGHFGTLDPDGEGVLPIALGRATRLFDIIKNDKIYYTEFVFGKTTDTLDGSGVFSEVNGNVPSEKEILSVIPSLVGRIMQLPPKYSAKSINGRRAYALAREGKEFDLKAKEIEIYSIDYLGKVDSAFAFRVSCSTGTYIRSLVRDMASALGTVGYMRLIRREQCGIFKLDKAVCLDEIAAVNDVTDMFIPMEAVLSFLPTYNLTDNAEGARLILNGVPLQLTGMPEGVFQMNIDGKLCGLGVKNEEGRFNWVVRLI